MKSSRILVTCTLVVALAVTLGAVGGCSDEPSATGTLVIQLTDAPFPYDMIAIADLGVDGVEVHVRAMDGGQSGFHVLSDSSQVFSLLDLSNGVTAFLGEVELPVGEIDQLRLLVSSASVGLLDQRTFDLNVPSGESSGLKVFFDPPIHVVANEETNVLIDVDASQSFRSIPASPARVDEITGFQFHPVLRVSVTDNASILAGRVTASADDAPIRGATVSLWEDGSLVTSTATDLNGEWMMLGVEPGAKILRAEAAGFVAAQTTVTATAGATTAGVDLDLDPAP